MQKIGKDESLLRDRDCAARRTHKSDEAKAQTRTERWGGTQCMGLEKSKQKNEY